MKLAVNAATILLLMGVIGVAAVLGIYHIQKNIFYLTQQSTPYQIKTFDHQRALQAHASNLLTLGASASAEEFKLNSARSNASRQEEMRTAEALIKLGSSSDYGNGEFSDITVRILEMTRKRLALQQETVAAVGAMRNHLAEASKRLQNLDASIRKLQTGATEKMVSNIVITSNANNQGAMIAGVMNGLKDLSLFATRLMNTSDRDTVQSLYDGTGAPLHKMRDAVGLIGWSGKLAQQDFVGSIDLISDKLTEAKELRLRFLESHDDAVKANAQQAIKDAETAIANVMNAAKAQEENSHSAQDASADAMSSSTSAFSSTNAVLILASGILFSSAVIDSHVNFSIATRNLAEFDRTASAIGNEFGRIAVTAGKLNAQLAKGRFRSESKSVAESLAALNAVKNSFFAPGGAAEKIRASLDNVEEVARLNQKMKEMVVRQMELSDKDVAAAQKSQLGAVSSVRAAVKTTTALIIAIAAVSVLCSVALSSWIGRSITGPIEELSTMAERFGAGHFGVTMNESQKDEFGRLGAHFNRATAKVAQMTGLLKESIEKLSAGSRTLLHTSDRLYSGVQEQVSQTTQSSVAMAQISATVDAVAGHARSSAAASREAHAIAANGNTLVTGTVKGMGEISDSVMAAATTIKRLSDNSDQIDSILLTINDIANQTNLLALNAAIEAARAGEQGRGFSVVADQVRQLAHRTAAATGEIAGIVRSIQHDTEGSVAAMEEGKLKVEEGRNLVSAASDSLNAIVAVSQRSVEMADLIATATDEQTTVSREISASMDRVANVSGTLKDSALEVKGASAQLSTIAEELNTMASWFKVAG